MLLEEVGEVGDEVPNNLHVRQGINLDFAVRDGLLDRLGASECGLAVDVHRTTAADALTARPSERESWVLFVLNLQERV